MLILDIPMESYQVQQSVARPQKIQLARDSQVVKSSAPPNTHNALLTSPTEQSELVAHSWGRVQQIVRFHIGPLFF